jgi:hypothetical protein
MAETVLKQPLNPLFFICFGKYFSTFSGFARTGSWLIFQHQLVSTGEAKSVLQAVEPNHVKMGKALTANNNTYALPVAA